MPKSLATYTAKRVLYLAVTIFLILTFNFLLFRVMPGDVSNTIIPKGASPEYRARLIDYYGLNDPLLEQYVNYMMQLLSGDLGETYAIRRGSEVTAVLGIYTMNTMILVGSATVISIFVGIYFGRETAWRRGSWVDRTASSFFLVFYCIPTFLFALILLMAVVAFAPSWPSHGTIDANHSLMSLFEKIGDRLIHLVLPLGALVLETIAVFSIITRSSLVDVLTEDYMVTAVAKGLRGRDVLRNHAMPNAMLPVVTVIALNVGWILSGAIMIEVVFSYQGLGWLTWKAVLERDYPLLQAAFMLEIVAVLIANFLADLALFKLDPRVKI
jgi:peptide/nickel transport system permease protein